MEAKAIDEFGAIDWSKIDWKAIIKQLMEMLLPFIIAFLGPNAGDD